MNDFETKWQKCAARARQMPAADEVAPCGFAARVTALARRPEAPSLDDVWQGLTLRLLAGAVGLLLVCAAMELPHLGQPRVLEPGIENTVAKLVWSL